MAVIGNQKYTKRVEKYLAKYPDKRSAVMPLLYIAQEEYGWVTDEAVREVAEICEMDSTQVKSIAGFYTMYRETTSGKHWIHVCTDLACALEGGDALYEKILAELGLDHHNDTSSDGMFTVEHAMCLGACDRAPMLQCNFHFSDAKNGEYRNLRDANGEIDMARVNTILAYWRGRERYD